MPRSPNKIQLNIDINPSLKADLKKLAHQKEMSMQSCICDILDYAVETMLHRGQALTHLDVQRKRKP